MSQTVRYNKGANRYYDAYNTALQLDTFGVQIYHKSKLVQGVEMMPFAPILKHFKWLSINLGGVSGSLVVNQSVLYSTSKDKLRLSFVTNLFMVNMC